MFTLVMRPFIASGVCIWRMMLRSTVLTMSQAPTTIRQKNVSQNARESPKPIVARVHGAALGRGSGLVAACDIPIAALGTHFGFTEVRLGIVPAVISPYVIGKIGQSAAR